MNQRYWLTEEDRNELREIRRDFRGQIPRGADIPDPPTPRGRGKGGGYFVLAENAMNHPVKMYEGDIDGTGAITIIDETAIYDLYYVNNVLRSPKQAQAGYSGLYVYDSKGRKVFNGNACITGCNSTGLIEGPPHDGVVGEEYAEYTMTFSGITGSGITAVNLPAGLTMDTDGVITGTPTTAGKYIVRFEGTSTDTPPCTVRKVYEIIISEP